jgi:hypothetical protein
METFLRVAKWMSALAVAFVSAAAFAAKPARGPAQLYTPQGSTATYAGGGTALAVDLSAVDANPAGLTLGKIVPGYFLATETLWTNKNIRTVEFGILDNASSELAAGMKVRRSTLATGAKAVRASLGLSEQLGTVPLFFGLAGDADFFEKPVSDSQRVRNYRLRGGVIYQLVPSFFVGARTGGWFDKSEGAEESHGVGVSWMAAERLAIAADAELVGGEVQAYVGSGMARLTEWLDVQAGYGYEVEASRHRVSGAVILHSEKFRLHYSVVRPADESLPLYQSLGFSFNVLAVGKE